MVRRLCISVPRELTAQIDEFRAWCGMNNKSFSRELCEMVASRQRGLDL